MSEPAAEGRYLHQPDPEAWEARVRADLLAVRGVQLVS